MTITTTTCNWSGTRPGVKVIATDDAGQVRGYIVCEPDRAVEAHRALEEILKPKGDADVR